MIDKKILLGGVGIISLNVLLFWGVFPLMIEPTTALRILFGIVSSFTILLFQILVVHYTSIGE